MRGRYRVFVVVIIGFALGGITALSSPPWWIMMTGGAVLGWFADNLARWIGRATP